MDMNLAMTIAAGIVMLFVMVLVLSIYQKCPPNQAMIVYGGMGTRIITSGGSPVWPMLEQRAYLPLEVMSIEMKTGAPIITPSGVPIHIEAIAQVKVICNEESIKAAAELFLGKSDKEVKSTAHEILIGPLRSLAGTMDVEQLLQNIDSFSSKIQEMVIPDLAKMGLTIVSLTIKDIKDDAGHIEQLDRKSTRIGEKNGQFHGDLQNGQAQIENLTELVSKLQSRVSELEKRLNEFQQDNPFGKLL